MGARNKRLIHRDPASSITRLDRFRSNARFARHTWGQLPQHALFVLNQLTEKHDLSVALGDVQFLNGRWYVTHAGLLSLAQRRQCSGIRTALQKDPTDLDSGRWVFKAVVYKSPRCRGFVGYGDADPSNVPSWLHGCELRIAETRAVNRALRKAYGIGLCSVEELGWTARSADSHRDGNNGSNGNHREPRLRDRLCQLIRQHKLDASLVKSYAAEFCGTQQLRDARRHMVEDFIQHLAEWAARDHDGLVCHLNRFAKTESAPQEVHA